jgi:Right handed beta helix region
VRAGPGFLLAADPFAQKELRAFIGGYYFNGPTGGQNIPGVYSRLEARLYDLDFLGQGSRLELGLISSYDNVNQLQFTGMVNLRIALGRTSCPGGLSLIERRMLDRIVRRQDMMTTNASTPPELAMPTINGVAMNPIFVNPGDNLQSTVQNAPNHSLIIVEGGGSPYLVPNGVVLNPGQAIAGGGTVLTVVGESTGHSGTYVLPGTAPTIERQNTAGPVLTLEPNSSVLGVKLVGGATGIAAGDPVGTTNKILISDVAISQSGGDGIQLLNITGLTMNNVTITQTAGVGALLSNVNDATFNGLTITHTAGTSLYYNCGTNVHMNNLSVDATGATGDAVLLHSQMQSVFTNFDIRNSSANALNVFNGDNITFDQIKLANVVGDGMQMHYLETVAVSGLTVNNVQGTGLDIDYTSKVTLNHSTFTNVNNVISFLEGPDEISGSNNVATGFTTLFTGTTHDGSSIQFTQPNSTAP